MVQILPAPVVVCKHIQQRHFFYPIDCYIPAFFLRNPEFMPQVAPTRKKIFQSSMFVKTSLVLTEGQNKKSASEIACVLKTETWISWPRKWGSLVIVTKVVSLSYKKWAFVGVETTYSIVLTIHLLNSIEIPVGTGHSSFHRTLRMVIAAPYQIY